ncbi:MAG TPA: nitroreductase family protein [Solirubrobacteraceae bacterium]|jgi:nitroreductase
MEHDFTAGQAMGLEEAAAGQAMGLEEAIRTRRTHKAFGPEPVPRETLLQLFELASWAPNHHLTNPWRFRVLGPRAKELLAEEAEREKQGAARKLQRAPTLVVVSVVLDGDEGQRRDDLLATAVAAYIVLLGAHAIGLASYWRSLSLLDTPAVRTLLGILDDEQPIGLLHLGNPIQAQRVPPRAPAEEIAVFLD